MAQATAENKIILCGIGTETVIAALTGDKCGCLYRIASKVQGAVHTGRVENVLSNLDAAFVRFEGKDTGFLPFRQVPDGALCNRPYRHGEALKTGDVLAVQTERAVQGTKQARLSACLSLAHTCTVLTYGKEGIGCSSKLPDDTRKEYIERLRKTLKSDARFPSGFLKEYGVILRTEAAPFMEDQEGRLHVADELYAAYTQLCKIREQAATRSEGSLLYRPDPDDQIAEYVTRLLHFLETPSRRKREALPDITLLTETEELCARLLKIPAIAAQDRLSVSVYASQHQIPLAKLYGLDRLLASLTRRMIRLKSGAYIVIDETEAMTVIDVNSGKNIHSKKDDFLRINQEAATEAMRQVRLRNHTGIILIDFINMKQASSYEALGKHLRELALTDVAHTQFVDFTALGLAEITRSAY